MEFIFFIGLVLMLFFLIKLHKRVKKLEERLQSSPSQPAVQPAQEVHLPALETSVETKQPENLTRQNEPSEPAKPSASDKFVQWLKEDWLLKLGALLLLIGFGWLTTYAFLNNWVGPMGRIALGIFAGALFIILGWWRIKKYTHQGGIFLVLGSTVVLLTIFAAREIYDFFTPLSALIVMFLSTSFVALASVKYKSRSLALASLILAGIAPLLTSSPSSDYVSLFIYLLVVILGAIWIVAITGMRELTFAALMLIGFYSLPHLFSLVSSDKGALLIIAYLFSAVFFLTNIAGNIKSKHANILSDILIAAGNGVFLLSWIEIAAQDEWKSLLISAWMLVFGTGAFLVFKATRRRQLFYIYAGISIAYLAAATAAELNGATLTIAYTVEAGLISIITYLISRNTKIAEQTIPLLIWPVLLSFNSIFSRAWRAGVIHKDFFVLLILAFTLIWLGIFFLYLKNKSEEKNQSPFCNILLIAGSIYAFLLLWLSLHAAFINNNTAVMISLVIYTIIGLISYFYGLTNARNGLRIYGGVLVGFVVGRLLLVDVWNMEISGKIVTFFLIGALLVSTAFLGRKKQASLTDNK